jgi:WD40 repeat protein
VQLLRGCDRRPERLAFSPDGRYLAAGHRLGLTLWDLAGGAAPLWSARDGNISRYFTFAPDGAAVLADWYAHRGYDARTGAAFDHPLPAGLEPTCFSDAGRLAAADYAYADGSVPGLVGARAAAGRWEVAWRREVAFDPAHVDNHWRAVLFSADGGRVVWAFARRPARPGSAPTGVRVFDAATGESVAGWDGDPLPSDTVHAAGPTGVVVLLDGRSLYALDPTVPGSGPVRRTGGSAHHLTAAAFSRDGTRLATVGNDGAATVWDAATWEVRRRYVWDVGRLRAVALSPDGLRCAAAGDVGRVVVWDLDD